jgi:hypothetical protein
MYGLKPVPFRGASGAKAPPILESLMYGLKPVPFRASTFKASNWSELPNCREVESGVYH